MNLLTIIFTLFVAFAQDGKISPRSQGPDFSLSTEYATENTIVTATLPEPFHFNLRGAPIKLEEIESKQKVSASEATKQKVVFTLPKTGFRKIKVTIYVCRETTPSQAVLGFCEAHVATATLAAQKQAPPAQKLSVPPSQPDVSDRFN